MHALAYRIGCEELTKIGILRGTAEEQRKANIASVLCLRPAALGIANGHSYQLPLLTQVGVHATRPRALYGLRHPRRGRETERARETNPGGVRQPALLPYPRGGHG